MEFPPDPLKLSKWLKILAAGGWITWLFASKSIALAATTNKQVSLFVDQNSVSTTNRSSQGLIAGANNFNPDLKLPPTPENLPKPILTPPPAKIEPPPSSSPSSGSEPKSPEPNTSSTPSVNSGPFLTIDSLQPDIHTDWNNSGQVNRTIEETASFRLNNGDRLNVKLGYDTYEQPGAKTVTNIPFQLSWETKINSLKVQPGVGIDLLDGSTIPNFNLKVDYPLATGFTLSGDIQQGAYKFNAKTIANQVSAVRYGPTIFWALDANTTIFSSWHFGDYSDGNTETQSFSRIERKVGEFSIAGNLFTWGYKKPTDLGYFAPSDFTVSTIEVGWEGTIADFLKCKIAVPFGSQTVNGSTSNAGGYQTKCTAKLSPNVEADLGYSFSNVKNQTTDVTTANSQSIGTQIRIKF